MEHCTGTPCISIESGREHYRTEIRADGHLLVADEPEALGGKNEGMNPNLFLLASLGSCTAITLRMYADRKKLPVEKIYITLSMDVVKSEQQQTTYISSHIRFDGQLTEEQVFRLREIADECPLHKIMTNPIVITTNTL